MNEIHVVQEGEIVFVDHPKYYEKALKCKASVVLINKKVECPEGKALLISDDPFRDLEKIQLFNLMCLLVTMWLLAIIVQYMRMYPFMIIVF